MKKYKRVLSVLTSLLLMTTLINTNYFKLAGKNEASAISDYGTLNDAERAIFNTLSESDQIDVLFDGADAKYYATLYYPDSLTDGDGDAFRHVLWMSMLTRDINATTAKNLGIAHENGSTSLSSKMDLKNNDFGIATAQAYPSYSDDQYITLIKDLLSKGYYNKISGNYLVPTGSSYPGYAFLGSMVESKGNLALYWDGVTAFVYDVSKKLCIASFRQGVGNTVNLNNKLAVKIDDFDKSIAPIKFDITYDGGSTNFSGTLTGQSMPANLQNVPNVGTIPSAKKYAVNADIPANKILVVSFADVSGVTIDTLTEININLANDNIAGISPDKAGGWAPIAKMAYFKTKDSTNKRYTITLSNNTTNSFNYSVKVYLIDTNAEAFVRANSEENASGSEKNYCISSGPEHADSPLNQYGDNKYYLQRCKLEGKANIYWEHLQGRQADTMFGVLLYNNGASSVTVKLLRRSFSSEADGDTRPTINVWKNWFAWDKKVDQSDFQTASLTQTIEAGGTRWICLYKIGPKADKLGITNGVVNVEIQAGCQLTCDTYFMSPGKELYTKQSVASARSAALPANRDNLRGSGSGAMISTKIDGSGPFRMALAGKDSILINSNENVSTVVSDGSSPEKSSQNYGVVYSITVNRTGISKLKMSFTNRICNAPPADSGAYIILKKYRPSTKEWFETKSSLLLTGNEYVFDDGGVQVGDKYLIVFSGMSSLPVEFSLY